MYTGQGFQQGPLLRRHSTACCPGQSLTIMLANWGHASTLTCQLGYCENIALLHSVLCHELESSRSNSDPPAGCSYSECVLFVAHIDHCCLASAACQT